MIMADVEKKINDWLLEEVQTITKIPNDKADFQIQVNNAVESKLSISLVKTKSRDLIEIITGLNINTTTKRELLKKQSHLLSELEIALATKGTPILFFPKLEEIKQIRIVGHVYATELTKTDLFKAMRDVRDSLFLANLIIRKYVKNKSSSDEFSSSNVGVG